MSALPNGAATRSTANMSAAVHKSSGPSSAPAVSATSGTTAAATTTTTTTPSKPTPSSKKDAADPSAALRAATTPAEVRAALSSLHAREATLTAQLDTLLASHADLARSLLRLDNLRAGLGAQVIAARGISNTMLAS
ncbi:hypothetical protein C8A05DRAFT_30214, partial [Staphylotrichum tortipilum]